MKMTSRGRMHVLARRTWQITRDVFEKWNEDNCFRLAAALSYYTLFSVGPVVIIIIYAMGALFGQEAIRGEIFEGVREVVGEEAARGVQNLVENAYLEGGNIITTVVGFGTLVFSATLIFSTLQQSLNEIWHVKAKPERGWLYFLTSRAISFVVVLGLGVMLGSLLIANTVLTTLNRLIQPFFETYLFYVEWLNYAQWFLSFAFSTFFFAALFKFLPDVQVRWRSVWGGALLTTVLFTIGRVLISYYLRFNDFSSTYGAAASVVILIVWVNYSSWIFFFGAEFIYVYLRHKGEFVRPAPNAVVVSRREVEDPDQYYDSLNEERARQAAERRALKAEKRARKADPKEVVRTPRQ